MNPIVYVNPDTIQEIPILLRLNQTFLLVLEFTDSTGETPIDFTSASFLMQVKSNNDSANAETLLELSTQNSYLSPGVDPTLGKLFFNIPLSVVSTITWSKGFFDLTMLVSGVTTVIAEGFIDTKRGITSAAGNNA